MLASVSGCTMIAARLTEGAISLSSSSHLPAIEGSKLVNPVTLPPGARVAGRDAAPHGTDATRQIERARALFCHENAISRPPREVELGRPRVARQRSAIGGSRQARRAEDG